MSVLLCFPSEKESALKQNVLLPMRANAFLLEQITNQKGPYMQENWQEVKNVVSLVSIVGKPLFSK